MFSFEFLKLSTIVSVKLNKFLSYFVSHKVKEVNSTAEKQLNQAPNLKATTLDDLRLLSEIISAWLKGNMR